MQKYIKKLLDKDDKKAYLFLEEIKEKSELSSEYYVYFEEFAGLLNHENLYIRLRGYDLCCAQARWDRQGKIQSLLAVLLRFLSDENPVVVMQCLGLLGEVAIYRPELHSVLKEELQNLDLSKYGDYMVVLIQKKLNRLLKIVE